MASITVPLGGYKDDHSYYAVSGSYPLTNAVGSTAAGGTKYAGINLARNANVETYIYMTFDLSELPENIAVKSITANVRIYGSTTSQSRTTNRHIQLYKGTTAVGESVSYDLTGSATISTVNDTSEWSREDLNELSLKVSATRNSSNTTTNTYLYWLGADVTVEYEEVSLVKHLVTIKTGKSITADKNTETQVREGTSFSVSFVGDYKTVTDNGINVTDQIKAGGKSVSKEIASNPTSYTTSGSISGTRYRNAVGQGSENTTTGNDYCSSSSSTATIYYEFDFSEIPENAIIESVKVVVGGHMESSSSSSEVANLQLYAGSVEKGSEASFTSTSKQLVTMDAGEWTRAELQEAELAFTIGYYGGLVNGVDFEVQYSVTEIEAGKYVYTIASVNEEHYIVILGSDDSGTPLRLKVDGRYKKILKIYRKVNGSWQEVEIKDIDLSTNFVAAN